MVKEGIITKLGFSYYFVIRKFYIENSVSIGIRFVNFFGENLRLKSKLLMFD